MNIRQNGLATDALHELLALGPAVIYVADAREPYGATFISANVKTQMGYETGDFIGDPNFWASHIHSEDAPRIFEQIPNLFDTGHHAHEYRFLHKDGDYRWMRDELTLVRDADGNPEKITGYWIDITERKLIELELEKARETLELHVAERTRELRQNEERFRDFVESSSDWIWEMDEQLRFTHIAKGRRSSGEIDPNIYIGKTRQESTSENTNSGKWLQHLDDLENHRPFRDFAFELKRPEGNRVAIRINGKPVFDRDGVFRGYRGTGSDITEQKRDEEQLRVLAERLALATKSARIGIWDWDIATDTLVWDERMYALFDVRAESFGTALEVWEKGVHPEDLARVREEISTAIAGAGEFHTRFRAVWPDGTIRHIEGHGLVQRAADGAAQRMTGVNRDITERVETERQLQQAQKMEAIGHLTGGIAHDFNNLLTAVLGNLEFLMEHTEGDREAYRLADTAFRAALRGAELTQRLLAFSRKQSLRPEAAGVNGLVSGVTELIQRTLGEDIWIETVLADDLRQAMVDRSQLENALLNLAINARDAMPDGGKLTIETSNTPLDQDYANEHENVVPGQYVMVAVSDNGAGMPLEAIEQAFEPFYTTKEVGKGSGLGLSMVYGFVRQSGGHIKIYSEVGKGTTVKLYLPRATGAGRGARVAKARENGQPGGDESILVVEDNPDVRAYVVIALARLGYRVMEAEDGPAALAMFENIPRVDLLLTDVVLPRGMNGRQVADEVQKRRSGVKVLFTSGYPKSAILHNGRLDENTELLTKPYSRETLARKVRAVLDSSRG